MTEAEASDAVQRPPVTQPEMDYMVQLCQQVTILYRSHAFTPWAEILTQLGVKGVQSARYRAVLEHLRDALRDTPRGRSNG